VDNAFVNFPNYWKHLFEDTPLCGAVPLGDGPEFSVSQNTGATREGRLWPTQMR
jgi:hypothetical protein